MGKQLLQNSGLWKISMVGTIILAMWEYVYCSTIFHSDILAVMGYLFMAMTFTWLFITNKNGRKLSNEMIWWMPYFLWVIIASLFGLMIAKFGPWLALFFLILMSQSCDVHRYLPIRLFLIAGVFFLAGIFFQILFPSLYSSYVYPFFDYQDMLDGVLLFRDINYGYNGFASQVDIPAVGMLYAEAVILYFFKSSSDKKGNRVYTILLVLLFFGILLTGKRSLSAIAIIAPLLVYFPSNKNATLLILTPFLLIIGYFAYDYFVTYANEFLDSPLLGRFAKSIIASKQGGDITSGRSELYEMAYRAFLDHPIFGVGVAGFEEYTGSYTAAHNSFLQVLCEQGIIGELFYAGPILCCLVTTVKSLKRIRIKEYKSYLQFSLFVQIQYIMYSMTGNPHLSMNSYIPYFVAIAVMIDVKRYSKQINIYENRNNYLSSRA